ncbi:MAG: FkbM family methyltransferase [Bacteroidota bacterium]
MIVSAYRSLVPEKFRLFLYSSFLKKILYYKRNFHILSKAFLAYRFNFFSDTELFSTLKFIGKHGLRSCPGDFSLKYDNYSVEVYRDDFPYVLHHDKKLYFPASFTDSAVKRLYKSLIVEQDIESAHRYSLDESDFDGSIMFDIGAAEGILTLEKIDNLKCAYLVECEAEFIDALKKTFEPYRSKIQIISKYIDQHDSDSTISLDTLGKDIKGEKVFVKMDIEGYEKKALLGGEEFLSGNNCIAAVCTYHEPSHPKEIKDILESLGYSTTPSKGYLYWDLRLSKALIRAKK